MRAAEHEIQARTHVRTRQKFLLTIFKNDQTLVAYIPHGSYTVVYIVSIYSLASITIKLLLKHLSILWSLRHC